MCEGQGQMDYRCFCCDCVDKAKLLKKTNYYKSFLNF